MNPFVPAFVCFPSGTTWRPVRRPRTAVSIHHRCSDVSNIARRVTMQTPQPPSSSPFSADAKPTVSSPKGFALQEALKHSFAELKVDDSLFQVGGAYAISDPADNIVYMGYTKNIAVKLAFHERLQPQSCASFRVYVPPVPPELMSPDMLENVLEYWVRENGELPRGNTVDKALWENDSPVDRKSYNNQTKTKAEENVDNDIPIRERTTQRRVPNRSEQPRYYSTDPFADAYRSTSPNAAKKGKKSKSGIDWDPSNEDYVEVDVDPFDPFSASSRPRTTRTSWSELDNDEPREDWYPIFLIMGFAGLVWLFGLINNALTAATPSLGM